MNSVFQQMGDVLVEILPIHWERVCLLGSISQSSYEFSFYVKVDGNYQQCFELQSQFGISRTKVSESFAQLYQLTKLDETLLSCPSFTLTITNHGQFHLDYDYDQIEDIVERERCWRAKYLT